MKKTSFTPEEMRRRELRWKFWNQVDCPALSSVQSIIFVGVKQMLSELRCIDYPCEGCRSNQETVSFVQRKLAAFIANSETEEDQGVLRMFRLIPGQYGVTGTAFSWFVSQGVAGREFFCEHQSDPDGFVGLLDIELAKELSELKEWDVIDIDY